MSGKQLATVLALAVVFAGLVGGGAYAAGKITSAQIQDGTIAARDIKNRTITTAKLAPATRRQLRGATGPAGAPGPAGPQGPAGPSAVAKLVRVEAVTTLPAGEIDGVTAICPAGHGVVTGGFASIGAETEVFASDSYGSVNSWSVLLDNFDSSLPADLRAYAYCAPSGIAVAARARAAVPRATREAISEDIRAQLRLHRD